MEKLYGDSLRKDAGFTKIIKNVAIRNARFLESRAGKHAPELQRVAQEVKGSFDKVFEETAEVVEELLNKCLCLSNYITIHSTTDLQHLARPRISEVVQDTKELLQHSRERLVIP
jgi:phosphatidylethanolamine N-methyltransferase